MYPVVKQNIEIHYVLARTDKYVSRRNVRKISRKPLRPRTHAGGRDRGHEKNVGDLTKLRNKPGGAGIKRLRRDKIRIGEIFYPLIGNIALKSPSGYIIYIERRGVSVLFFQQTESVRIAFVKYIIHVKPDAKSVFSHL